MPLHLLMFVPNDLACFAINPDGSDGCRVAFVAREYAAGENGTRFASALVRLVAVTHPSMKTGRRNIYTITMGMMLVKFLNLLIIVITKD